jgi:hypothetical protein
MRSARDGLTEVADRSAFRDAVGDFALSAPLVLLIANVVVDLYRGYFVFIVRSPWLVAPHGNAGHLAASITVGLLAAGQLPLVIALALGRRRPALAILAAIAGYWVVGYQGGFHLGSPTVMFYLGFCGLEAAALLSVPLPRGAVTWRRCAILASPAILVGCFWINALATPGQVAGIVILALLAGIGAALAWSGPRARYLVVMLAVMLYPSAIDIGLPAGRFSAALLAVPAWAALVYVPPVVAVGVALAGPRRRVLAGPARAT